MHICLHHWIVPYPPTQRGSFWGLCFLTLNILKYSEFVLVTYGSCIGFFSIRLLFIIYTLKWDTQNYVVSWVIDFRLKIWESAKHQVKMPFEMFLLSTQESSNAWDKLWLCVVAALLLITTLQQEPPTSLAWRG